MDEIVISGGVVTLRTVQELRRVAVDEFQDRLASLSGVRTPLLPDRVRCYASKDGVSVYATHQEPRAAELTVRPDKRSDETVSRTIKLPHVWFFHRHVGQAFDKLFAYCSAARIESQADTLCRLPVKNLHAGGEVCIGTGLRFDMDGKLAAKIAKAESFFWGSLFNSDLDGCMEGAAPREFLDGRLDGEDPLDTWARLSASDGFDPLAVAWKPFKSWSGVLDLALGR